jgi:hypothetical protein
LIIETNPKRKKIKDVFGKPPMEVETTFHTIL